jgi:hypothetical protein
MYCPWWQCNEAAMIEMAYSVEEHVFLIKRFYQTAGVIKIRREFRVKSVRRKAPSMFVINILVKKFKMNQSVFDNKNCVVGDIKSVR